MSRYRNLLDDAIEHIYDVEDPPDETHHEGIARMLRRAWESNESGPLIKDKFHNLLQSNDRDKIRKALFLININNWQDEFSKDFIKLLHSTLSDETFSILKYPSFDFFSCIEKMNLSNQLRGYIIDRCFFLMTQDTVFFKNQRARLLQIFLHKMDHFGFLTLLKEISYRVKSYDALSNTEILSILTQSKGLVILEQLTVLKKIITRRQLLPDTVLRVLYRIFQENDLIYFDFQKPVADILRGFQNPTEDLLDCNQLSELDSLKRLTHVIYLSSKFDLKTLLPKAYKALFALPQIERGTYHEANDFIPTLANLSKMILKDFSKEIFLDHPHLHKNLGEFLPYLLNFSKKVRYYYDDLNYSGLVISHQTLVQNLLILYQKISPSLLEASLRDMLLLFLGWHDHCLGCHFHCFFSYEMLGCLFDFANHHPPLIKVIIQEICFLLYNRDKVFISFYISKLSLHKNILIRFALDYIFKDKEARKILFDQVRSEKKDLTLDAAEILVASNPKSAYKLYFQKLIDEKPDRYFMMKALIDRRRNPRQPHKNLNEGKATRILVRLLSIDGAFCRINLPRGSRTKIQCSPSLFSNMNSDLKKLNLELMIVKDPTTHEEDLVCDNEHFAGAAAR